MVCGSSISPHCPTDSSSRHSSPAAWDFRQAPASSPRGSLPPCSAARQCFLCSTIANTSLSRWDALLKESWRLERPCRFSSPPASRYPARENTSSMCLRLNIPAPETRDLASVLKYGAAELLVARARAAAPTLSFDQRAVDAIGAICRRLDGIPLALELAAARIPALGLQIVRERLERGFDLLSRGRRTGLARHHTLRATFDWSYQLLPEEHRAIFRRLSVFTGSFSLGAVRAILANTSHPENRLVDGLADLVAKSLLVADISGAEPRFRMLDTTRAYSAARLGETGEQETLRKRHAEYYRDLVVAAPDPTAAGWSAQLAPELDNLRAALA